MKIVIFTQNLDIGGVQKSVVNLANFLAKFYKIYIILAEDNKKIKYKLNKTIKIEQIKTKKVNITKKHTGVKIFNYRVKELNKLLLEIKPNIAMSFEDYNNFILMNTQNKYKKIYSIRVSQSMYKNQKVHLLDEKFYKENIKKYQKNVIAVNDMIKKDLPCAKVIYNGIENKKPLEQKETNYILNVGRLHSQKGQVDLIKAYNLIKDDIKENLIIVGDGVLKNELQSLINRYKLNDRVKLVGFDNPYKYYKNASLFLFPSYYEGFPNTLLEAIKSKCAVIGYNFEGSQILLEKVEVGDYKSLANKIKEYLNDKNKIVENINKHQKVIKQYKLNKTLREYKRYIEKCVAY